MKYSHYIGIDVGNSEIAVAVYSHTLSEKPLIFESILNSEKGFKNLKSLLSKAKIDLTKAIFCMEHCGVYGEKLCDFLHRLGYDVAVEDPIKIKRAFRKLQPKNDVMDSQRIAQYAYRFEDELTLWKPRTPVSQSLQCLLTLREQLVKQSTAIKNIIKSQKKKATPIQSVLDVSETTLSHLKVSIKQVEGKMKEELSKNAKTLKKVQLVCSIPGVSILLASHLVVLTNEFHKEVNPKKLASYLGICPNEYSSGSSVYKKPRSRGFGPSVIRKVLHMCAICICSKNQIFKDYMDRKVAQGKSKMAILNNIKNKVLKIIAAVLRDNQPFVPNHISLSPVLLQKALTKA
jgi:transposase